MGLLFTLDQSLDCSYIKNTYWACCYLDNYILLNGTDTIYMQLAVIFTRKLGWDDPSVHRCIVILNLTIYGSIHITIK